MSAVTVLVANWGPDVTFAWFLCSKEADYYPNAKASQNDPVAESGETMDPDLTWRRWLSQLLMAETFL